VVRPGPWPLQDLRGRDDNSASNERKSRAGSSAFFLESRLRASGPRQPIRIRLTTAACIRNPSGRVIGAKPATSGGERARRRLRLHELQRHHRQTAANSPVPLLPCIRRRTIRTKPSRVGNILSYAGRYKARYVWRNGPLARDEDEIAIPKTLSVHATVGARGHARTARRYYNYKWPRS